MLFKTALPAFYSEVERLLAEEGRTDLVEQLPGLQLARRCTCKQRDCATFYVTGARPLNVVEKNVIGVRHGESIPLDADTGWVIFDVDNFGRPRGIEVLNRDDVFEALERLGDEAWFAS